MFMAVTMYYYAYLNAEDIVEQIFDMPAPITSPQYISISSHDETLIGKRYNRETGQFEEVIEYVQVTADDKRLWDGKPICGFTVDKASVKIAGMGEYTVKIPFETGKVGYLPRKIYMQIVGTGSSGFGEALELTSGMEVVLERDEDDTRRMYVNFENSQGKRCVGYIKNPLSDEIFYYLKESDGTVYHTGGNVFINQASNGDKHIYIGRFVFDTKSVSFTYKIPASYTTLSGKYRVRGLVY